MWILILSLYFMQQESGTKVEVQNIRIDGIATEKACKSGGEAWKDAHAGVATEPHYDNDGKKLDKDWDLVTPVYACIPTALNTINGEPRER